MKLRDSAKPLILLAHPHSSTSAWCLLCPRKRTSVGMMSTSA